MAHFEARRGPLEGLKEIADDPAYLAEWQEQSDAKPESPAAGTASRDSASDAGAGSSEPLMIEVSVPETSVTVLDSEARPADPPVDVTNSVPPMDKPPADSPPPRPEPAPPTVPNINPNPAVRLMSQESPVDVLLRHVASDADESGFLPCLRRGVAVPAGKVAELTRALIQLENELEGADVISRRTAHALHRLALEAQVMLTDAWPDAFDAHMINEIRTVQEAVERILSGQDIRYYRPATPSPSEQPR